MRKRQRRPITLVVEAVDWEGTPTGWYFCNERRERIALKASWDEVGKPILLDEGSSPTIQRLRPTTNGVVTGLMETEL